MRRTIQTIVFAAAFIGCAWVGGMVFNVFLGIVAAICWVEWIRLSTHPVGFVIGAACLAPALATLWWLRSQHMIDVPYLPSGLCEALLIFALLWSKEIGTHFKPLIGIAFICALSGFLFFIYAEPMLDVLYGLANMQKPPPEEIEFIYKAFGGVGIITGLIFAASISVGHRVVYIMIYRDGAYLDGDGVWIGHGGLLQVISGALVLAPLIGGALYAITEYMN